MITQPVKNQSLSSPSFLELSDGRKLAYCLTPGTLPGIVFLSGFRSDMTGTKAAAVESFCREEGVRCLRFDYSGHGQSSGDFMDCTIGGWVGDCVAMLDYVAAGPNILVGSSMGAWLMILAALHRPEQVTAMVGVASAPDFTERLIWQQMDEAQKIRMETEGAIYLPSCSGEPPYPITRQLIGEGRNHLLLDADIPLDIPVRLIHGAQDKDVPWQFSVKLMERLRSPDISLELVKGGDHRLSYPAQLAVLARTVEELL